MPAQRGCVIGIGIQERLIATLRKRHADIHREIHKGIGVDSRKGSYYNRNVPGHPLGEVRG